MRKIEKNKMIAIRLSENDYKKFKDNTEKLGVSLTDYFVDLLYKQNINVRCKINCHFPLLMLY